MQHVLNGLTTRVRDGLAVVVGAFACAPNVVAIAICAHPAEPEHLSSGEGSGSYVEALALKWLGRCLVERHVSRFYLGFGIGGVRDSRGNLVFDAGVPASDGSEECIGLGLAVVDRGNHADVLGHLKDLVLVRFRLRWV